MANHNHNSKQKKELIFLSLMITTTFLLSHANSLPEIPLYAYFAVISGLLVRVNYLLFKKAD